MDILEKRIFLQGSGSLFLKKEEIISQHRSCDNKYVSPITGAEVSGLEYEDWANICISPTRKKPYLFLSTSKKLQRELKTIYIVTIPCHVWHMFRSPPRHAVRVIAKCVNSQYYGKKSPELSACFCPFLHLCIYDPHMDGRGLKGQGHYLAYHLTASWIMERYKSTMSTIKTWRPALIWCCHGNMNVSMDAILYLKLIREM